jgi:hypothetical protein
VLHGDTIATLKAWEAEFPVLSWTVGGMCVWPIVRTRMASRLLAAGAPPAPRPVGRATPDGEGLAPGGRPDRAAIRSRGEQPAVAVADAAAIFLGRPANRQWLDGCWYDRLFDPIADILEADGLRGLHLEYRPTGSAYLAPRYRPAIAVRGAVSRRNVVAALASVRPAHLERFDAFTRTVKAACPGVAPVSAVWVARQARSVDLVARYFERLMRRSGARVACCSVYNTLVGMAFCLAARRSGIPAVDVQHGVTAGNPAYEGWSRVPEDGFALLPSHFWCWSETDARPVRGWPSGAAERHRAFVGGHPWLALWRSARPLAAALRARLPDRGGASLAVLVTLNWSSGFSDRLTALMRSAPRDWTWWIRLHPLMTRERAAIRSWCASEMPGRADVDAATDLPLPLLVEAADVHVTHNSTVIQEAARLGTPSVAIDARAIDVYADELASGWAVFAGDTPAIVEAVRSQQRHRSTLTPLAPYPSWADMTRVVRDLVAGSGSCLATARAASSPTPARV